VIKPDGRLTDDLDSEDRPPRDACGVFGVWSPGEDVAKLAYFGLYALQHRGQESAGIAVSDGTTIVVFKDMGLVPQVFDEAALNSLRGYIAVGHCRYSTSGSSVWHNAQPTFRATPSASLALGHNGNLINTLELAELVEAPANGGRAIRATSDTDVLTSLFVRPAGGDPTHADSADAAGQGIEAGAMSAAAGAGSVLAGVHGRADPVRRA
jgi:amidophosphoribosyltransferase